MSHFKWYHVLLAILAGLYTGQGGEWPLGTAAAFTVGVVCMLAVIAVYQRYRTPTAEPDSF